MQGLWGDIRTAELLHPRSHVSGSLFAKHFTLCDIDRADFITQGAFGHEPFLDQHIYEGSLHSPTGRVSCTHNKVALRIRRVIDRRLLIFL